MTFEARTTTSDTWKKLIDSMKELVNEVNFECGPTGIAIQSMDAAHVALCSMLMRCEGFEMFHMERNCVLGMNMGNLAKILKTVDSKDSLTLKHAFDDNVLSLISAQKEGNRKSEFSLKLMEIDSDSMGIPAIDYKCSISMSSSDFAKICRDMSVFGDTITVSVSREGVKFSAEGDIGGGHTVFNCPVTLVKPTIKAEQDAANEEQQQVKEEIKAEAGVKLEVKEEAVESDAAPQQQQQQVEIAVPVKEEVKREIDDDTPFAALHPNADAAAAADGISAQMSEPVELSFALRYFTTFSKGSSLSDRVSLHLSHESPCMVEFIIENVGYLRYFLAPKVEAADQ